MEVIKRQNWSSCQYDQTLRRSNTPVRRKKRASSYGISKSGHADTKSTNLKEKRDMSINDAVTVIVPEVKILFTSSSETSVDR